MSSTENLVLISKKIAKLEKYKDCKKMFFFSIPSQEIDGQKIIDIKTIINDFRNDKYYERLLSELN